jgi:hypothetical protein
MNFVYRDAYLGEWNAPPTPTPVVQRIPNWYFPGRITRFSKRLYQSKVSIGKKRDVASI